MSDQTRATAVDDEAASIPAGGLSPDVAVETGKPGKKRKKKTKKSLEERHVYEAGGIIVCDGKVVLRLTDKQRWIFPKGKLKKHESARDAALREATEETGLRVEILDEIA